MPDTVKSLKIENYSLKSEVASLKVALKNLEASIERRLTQASEQNGSRMSEPDKETARSLNYLSILVMTSYRASEWRPKLILNAWINDLIV
jgi:hypothetical protein